MGVTRKLPTIYFCQAGLTCSSKYFIFNALRVEDKTQFQISARSQIFTLATIHLCELFMLIGIGFGDEKEKFDFWSVYKSIIEYYPIGIDNVYPGPFFEYDGIKKLEDIVVKKVHDDKNFQNEWSNYWDTVSEEIGLPIIGTTYGQAPSFSSFILLKEEKGQHCDYFEELHFCVSFVGPFYTIISQSRTEIHGQDKFTRFKAVNKVTSSPTPETKRYFELLAKKIESKYPDYKFVPYHINELFIEGLRVRYRDEKHNRVYNALFNNLVDFDKYNDGDCNYRP